MMSLRSSSALTSAGVLAVAGIAASAHAANISWSGNVGNWGVGANWVGGNVPGNVDNVTIDQANASVTLDGANTTVRSLTLNRNTAALTVLAKTLKVNFASSVTAGTLNMHASNAGGSKLDFPTNFSVGNGGKIVMDAPATAGNVDLFGTLSFNLGFGAGSELIVNKGAGGKRTIFGNTSNAGVWRVNHDLTVDITAGGNGGFTGTLDNSGGDLRVDANAFFNVLGDNADNCNFVMKGNGQNGNNLNRLLTGKGTSLTKVTFDFQGGLIRNAADNARGGMVATDSRLKLTSTSDVFISVQGMDSKIATGVKGANQELYVTGTANNVGAALAYEGNVKFENKGKISFNTRANTNNIDFDGNNQQIENTGTMQTLGGGKVTLKGQVINKGTFSVQTPTRWDKANVSHVNDAGGTISFDAQGQTLELNNTMSNFGSVALGNGVRAGTLKGVAAATNRMRNRVNGKIQPGIQNLGGLAPRPGAGEGGAFAITHDAGERSIGAGVPVIGSPAVLTIDMGLDCEPGSAIESKLVGLSGSTFDWGVVEVLNGGLDLGGSGYNLFLEGFEPSVGQSFPIISSDSFIAGVFDLGNGVSDTLYPIGGSGSLSFRVDYNVPDFSNPGRYLVTLTAQAVPTPGTASLMGLAGLLASRRKR